MTEPIGSHNWRVWNWEPPPFQVPPPINDALSDDEVDVPPVAGYWIDVEDPPHPRSK